MKIEASNKFFPAPGGLWDQIINNAIARIRSLDNTKCWHIEIRKYVKERTEKQRGALFGPAYKVIMDYMGLRGSRDKEYLHSFICCLYYGCHPIIPNKPIRTTTTDEDGNRVKMTTEQAIDFYAFIQQWAAEQGVYVPDPDPLWRENQETDKRAA